MMDEGQGVEVQKVEVDKAAQSVETVKVVLTAE